MQAEDTRMHSSIISYRGEVSLQCILRQRYEGSNVSMVAHINVLQGSILGGASRIFLLSPKSNQLRINFSHFNSVLIFFQRKIN